MLGGELGPKRERLVEDERIGVGDEQAGGGAVLVALDDPAGGLGRVLGVPDGAQGGAVQERAVIQVQDEDRGVRRRLVQLRERRQTPLGELQLREAAHDAHPLPRRRAGDLLAEHAHRIGEAGHAVPAQLEVVVEPPADDVQVRIVEAGDDAPAPPRRSRACRARALRESRRPSRRLRTCLPRRPRRAPRGAPGSIVVMLALCTIRSGGVESPGVFCVIAHPFMARPAETAAVSLSACRRVSSIREPFIGAPPASIGL